MNFAQKSCKNWSPEIRHVNKNLRTVSRRLDEYNQFWSKIYLNCAGQLDSEPGQAYNKIRDHLQAILSRW